MAKHNQQNKITELAIKKNLLLWQLSRSLFDLNKELIEINKSTIDNSKLNKAQSQNSDKNELW